MSVIKPFQALRPKEGMGQVVSSKSWDSHHNHLSRLVMENNEFSYLHVVKPHLNFSDGERIPEKHFPYAKTKLDELKELGVLIKDEKPCFYLYLVHDLVKKIDYFGIVGIASIDDYLNGSIKKHENTISRKEDALVEHINYVHTIGEPVLLTFEAGLWYDALIEKVQTKQALYDFTGDEGVQTVVWMIDESDEINAIEQAFLQLPSLYIADGHHRSAGAAKFCLSQRAINLNYDGTEAFNYFLAYFIPTNRLKVFEFNRLVKDLNGLTEDEFLDKLREKFSVTLIGSAALKVKKKQARFGLYLNKKWYGLDLLPNWKLPEDVLSSLDVSILENEILKPILNIQDSKTDERIAFVDGTKGIHRLQEMVDIGEFIAAFSLYPTKVEEVIAVADANGIMPPKSTWFEPKLRTGLLAYEVGELSSEH